MGWITTTLDITGQLTTQRLFQYCRCKRLAMVENGIRTEVWIRTLRASQKNGWFTINEREGKFSFSSGLSR